MGRGDSLPSNLGIMAENVSGRSRILDSSPAIGATGMMMYVGAQDGMAYAFNSNGTLLWSYVGGNQFNSYPAIGVWIGSR